MSVNNVDALHIIRQQINPTEEGIQQENESASIFLNGKDEKPNPLNDLKESVKTESNMRTGDAPEPDKTEKKKSSLFRSATRAALMALAEPVLRRKNEGIEAGVDSNIGNGPEVISPRAHSMPEHLRTLVGIMAATVLTLSRTDKE